MEFLPAERNAAPLGPEQDPHAEDPRATDTVARTPRAPGFNRGRRVCKLAADRGGSREPHHHEAGGVPDDESV